VVDRSTKKGLNQELKQLAVLQESHQKRLHF